MICRCCGTMIGEDRRGSLFDWKCNELLNRRGLARTGTYEERLRKGVALHLWLRGAKPGWGAYRLPQLRRLMAGRVPTITEQVYGVS